MDMSEPDPGVPENTSAFPVMLNGRRVYGGKSRYGVLRQLFNSSEKASAEVASVDKLDKRRVQDQLSEMKPSDSDPNGSWLIGECLDPFGNSVWLVVDPDNQPMNQAFQDFEAAEAAVAAIIAFTTTPTPT